MITHSKVFDLEQCWWCAHTPNNTFPKPSFFFLYSQYDRLSLIIFFIQFINKMHEKAPLWRFALLPQIWVRRSSARWAWVVKCDHLEDAVGPSSWISSFPNIPLGHNDVNRATANERQTGGLLFSSATLSSTVHVINIWPNILFESEHF